MLIEAAKSRENIDGYFETHHIIPRSLGGTDSIDNLVKLTAKEHYIAHRLLAKFERGNARYKMIFALQQMMFDSSKKRRYVPSSRSYSHVRTQLSVIQKEQYSLLSIEEKSNKFGYWKNKKRPKEFSEKIKIANSGKKRTDEMKQKYSNSKIGKKLSNQHKSNLSISHLGISPSNKGVRGKFKWYNDGMNEYFMKSDDVNDTLQIGRLKIVRS